jgi:general secretion pathway protein C
MTAALRRLPVLTLALGATWLAARGVGVLLLPEPVDGIDLGVGGVEPPAPATAPLPLPLDLEQLAAANLFALPPPAASPDPSPQPAVLTTLPPGPSVAGPCRLPYRAVALVAFDGAAADARSFAAVERGGGVTEVRVGDHLDDAEVTRIGWNRLFLRRAGEPSECWLDLRAPPSPPGLPSRRPDAGPPPEAAPPEPAAPPAPATREERFAAAVAAGIAPLGEDEFAVERSILATAAEYPDLATGAARVTPARDGAATIGFRLFGVRPDSLAGRLGLRTGDVVTAVNGIPLDGVDNLMRVWGLVRQAETIEAVVLRRGDIRRLTYRIR